MRITFPHTIQNTHGETLIFRNLLPEADGDRLLVENVVAPACGPPMHTHFLQDESLTVMTGRLGYKIEGGKEGFAGPGETVEFKRGVPHKFWNAGTDLLTCTGWVKPANTLVFFLSAVYAAQNKSGKAEPEKFDAAYLLTRYHSEYDMAEIPPFVKKVILPLTYRLGQLLGKYKHFENAPEPLR